MRRGGRRRPALWARVVAVLAAALILCALWWKMPAVRTSEAPDTDGGKAQEVLLPEGVGDRMEALADRLWESEDHETYQRRGDVEQVAGELLQTYRDQGDCVLAQEGYLDLLGNVWGCVVFGGSWADVCLVGQQEQGESCEVQVLHLGAQELAQLFEEMEDEEVTEGV